MSTAARIERYSGVIEKACAWSPRKNETFEIKPSAGTIAPHRDSDATLTLRKCESPAFHKHRGIAATLRRNRAQSFAQSSHRRPARMIAFTKIGRWAMYVLRLSFLGMILAATPALAFDIEAHRGGRALLPENTLPAFANALSMGVDTLELDTGVTKDGVVVVSHERGLNPDLARGPDGAYAGVPEKPFITLPLATVKTYDVGQIRPGSDYAKGFPEQHGEDIQEHPRAPQHRNQDRSQSSGRDP
jgi:hypothetical protein